MLDAAAGALAAETASVTQDYVQTSKDVVAETASDADEAPSIAASGVANTAPSNIQIAPPAAINENGVASLELTFDDPDPLDTHTVQVAWGDGSVEGFNVPQGSQFFGTTHQYLDDNPSGTS
jgi:hypothetical protein